LILPSKDGAISPDTVRIIILLSLLLGKVAEVVHR
jgi:hypothetical protein